MIRTDKKIFIIEGNIGAGKSTFLTLIQSMLPVQIVYEPVQKWQSIGAGENVLEKFYTDTKRWAYTFQSYAFITRLIEQQESAKYNVHPYQVLERSVYSDRYCFAKNCYEMGTMTQLEWSLYQQWFEWLVTSYAPKPHGFIYLQTNPTTCYERLKKRARSEESSVSLEYLQLLHEKHETWLVDKKNILSQLHDIPVLVLDCNQEFENDAIRMEYLKDQIMTFITHTSTLNNNHAVAPEIQIQL